MEGSLGWSWVLLPQPIFFLVYINWCKLLSYVYLGLALRQTNILTFFSSGFAANVVFNSTNWLVEGTAVIGDREIVIEPCESVTPLE